MTVDIDSFVYFVLASDSPNVQSFKNDYCNALLNIPQTGLTYKLLINTLIEYDHTLSHDYTKRIMVRNVWIEYIGRR